MNDTFIRNITKIKKVAAKVNGKHGYIKLEISQTIDKACVEILNGQFQEDFITDAVQGGAGTTVNMNVNEVIANRATEILGGKKGEYICHPNDLFGDKSFSKVLGIFVSFNQVGYALGAPVINLFYDFTGSYKTSLLICVGLMLAVVTLLQFVITSAHKERKRIMETL